MIRSLYKQWQSLNTASHNFIQKYNKLMFEVSGLVSNAEYFERVQHLLYHSIIY